MFSGRFAKDFTEDECFPKRIRSGSRLKRDLKKQKKKKWWRGQRLNSKFKEFDIYGEQIGLTYKGDSSFKTTPGAITSLLVLLCMVAFSIYRFSVFINKQDPDVSRQFFLRNLDSENETLTPSDFGNEIAFGIGKPIEPEYGSMVASIVEYYYKDEKTADPNVPRERIKTKRLIDMVPCGFDYFKGFDRAKVNMYNIPK